MLKHLTMISVATIGVFVLSISSVQAQSQLPRPEKPFQGKIGLTRISRSTGRM